MSEKIGFIEIMFLTWKIRKYERGEEDLSFFTKFSLALQ